MNVDSINTDNDVDLESKKHTAAGRVNKVGPFSWRSYLNPADYPTHFTTFIFACIAVLFLILLFINYQFQDRVQHWRWFKLCIYYLTYLTIPINKILGFLWGGLQKWNFLVILLMVWLLIGSLLAMWATLVPAVIQNQFFTALCIFMGVAALFSLFFVLGKQLIDWAHIPFGDGLAYMLGKYKEYGKTILHLGLGVGGLLVAMYLFFNYPNFRIILYSAGGLAAAYFLLEKMGNVVFFQNVRNAFNNLVNNTANEIKITSSFSLLVLMAEIIFLTLYLILPKLAKSATDKDKGDEFVVIKKKENEKKIKELNQYVKHMKNGHFWEKMKRWATSFETFYYEIDIDWDTITDGSYEPSETIIKSTLHNNGYRDPINKNLWYYFGFRNMSLTDATARVKKYAKYVADYEKLIKDLEEENKSLKKEYVKFKTINLIEDTKQLDEAITIRHDEIFSLDTQIKNYEFAISMWVYLYTQSSVSNKFSNIINVGGKPILKFKEKTQKLFILVDRLLKDYDPEKDDQKDNMKSGDRIVYQGEDVLPMQRWNNIIINYNTKQMDVFINGKLLKTIKNVIPNEEKKAIIIGENGGLRGAVTDAVYYPRHLSYRRIQGIYEYVDKIRKRPVSN